MSDEADTPESELRADFSMKEIMDLAQGIENARVTRRFAMMNEEKLQERLLPLMEAKGLHGVLLESGTAVRRVWSVQSTKRIEPSRLRELLMDAPNYISEQVNMAALHKDYPSIWEQLGKPKREQVISVRFKGEQE
jgi:hypothetical protein